MVAVERLACLEAAGQLGSFTAAAARLPVAQSAVSRHVAVLERFLGLPPSERRHRRLVLTEAGRHLLPIVTRSFDRLDGARGDIIQGRGAPGACCASAMPPTFAARLAVRYPLSGEGLALADPIRLAPG